MIYKNRDLLFWAENEPRSDELFVVTEEPVLIRRTGLEKTATVRIHLDALAAVLDQRADAYPNQPTVAQIHQGIIKGWLLSGGALIADHLDRIAVGLRDGNAADRFVLTNIGAGRCDRRLQDHCNEEHDSEFILCVKQGGTWHQIIFGPQTLPIKLLNKPDVHGHLAALGAVMGSVELPALQHSPIASGLTGQIMVEWYDHDGLHLAERLSGYVYIDRAVNTTEFRLAMRYDLSRYEDLRIFFGEGTGYAEWLSLEQIRRLRQAEKTAHRPFITSFLRHL